MAHSDFEQPDSSGAAPVPVPARSRDTGTGPTGLPWHWLGVAFLVVLILAAVIYVIRGMPTAPPEALEYTPTVVVVSDRPRATPRRSPPTAMATPELRRTPTPQSSPIPVDVEIKEGADVRVKGTGVEGLSFRSGPGVNYARLKTVYDDEIFTVLEGPEEAGGHVWWRLEDAGGTAGWGSETWLELVTD